MFLGREEELGKLEGLYRAKGFQFPVIYGRRRVGKTALINEFIKGKEAIFFTGIESNARQNLENFSRAVLSYADAAGADAVFPSFQAGLEYVFRLAEKRRLILVIDEYPYVAKASKSFASVLQALIDKNKGASQLFLVLCGSSMSFMENNVLGYKAPLYGRRTAQFKIQPFDFFESRKFFKRFSDLDAAMVYGIVGGTPQYLLQFDDRMSVKENIKRCFFDQNSPLFEEPPNLLKQETRESASYNAVIAAIASGCTKLSEISTRVGGDTSASAAQIKNLIALGIVKKETPILDKSMRRTVYIVNDNLFRFWYRFVPDNIAAITRGFADDVYKRIEPAINDYMGAVFEEICAQYLWKKRAKGESLIEFIELGRWWGNDPINKCEAEIDIIGTDGVDAVLFCECKWTNKQVDLGILETLLERSRLFRFPKVRILLFAKTGFTKGCVDKANTLGNVTLVTFGEMCSRS